MHASRDERGALSIAGVDCRDLVAEFGSPLYVLDEQQVRVTARRYREAYELAGAGIVYYAAKAFIATAVARWVHEEGLGLDVASAGELEVAVRAGIPGDRIIMHGNNKSMADIERAIETAASSSTHSRRSSGLPTPHREQGSCSRSWCA